MAYLTDESRIRRNHGAMQFVFKEIGTEQTSNPIRRPSIVLDLSLVRGRPTILLADEESISTLDDLFPERDPVGKPGLGGGDSQGKVTPCLGGMSVGAIWRG